MIYTYYNLYAFCTRTAKNYVSKYTLIDVNPDGPAIVGYHQPITMSGLPDDHPRRLTRIDGTS